MSSSGGHDDGGSRASQQCGAQQGESMYAVGVREALERILASPEFDVSAVLSLTLSPSFNADSLTPTVLLGDSVNVLPSTWKVFRVRLMFEIVPATSSADAASAQRARAAAPPTARSLRMMFPPTGFRAAAYSSRRRRWKS